MAITPATAFQPFAWNMKSAQFAATPMSKVADEIVAGARAASHDVAITAEGLADARILHSDVLGKLGAGASGNQAADGVALVREFLDGIRSHASGLGAVSGHVSGGSTAARRLEGLLRGFGDTAPTKTDDLDVGLDQLTFHLRQGYEDLGTRATLNLAPQRTAFRP